MSLKWVASSLSAQRFYRLVGREMFWKVSTPCLSPLLSVLGWYWLREGKTRPLYVQVLLKSRWSLPLLIKSTIRLKCRFQRGSNGTKLKDVSAAPNHPFPSAESAVNLSDFPVSNVTTTLFYRVPGWNLSDLRTLYGSLEKPGKKCHLFLEHLFNQITHWWTSGHLGTHSC